MQYFGGKARIGKHIANVINTYIKNNNVTFISPFVGGGYVECRINSNNKLLCDKHTYLIEMYKALRQGWIPPTIISKEEYEYIKNHKNEKPYLTGFVGFGCSYSGKWFVGYAKNKSQRNYCLNAHNSIMKKINSLYNAEFKCCDYKELKPKGSIIYCDPPYKGTTQYDKSIVGKFNTEEFWDIMRKWSKNNKVFISEYEAPDDFKCIWSKETKLDIRDKN
ncbi:DNA adenine methylase, partial [Clostridium botulinum]|uniref:DNA adenine methylase n=1 Tax=Clostridium botulinum TaxID=1491 RepID=UPI002F2B59C5